MGWAYGVINGHEVGYSVKTICEYPDCNQEIDRGLAYVCGGEHGETDFSCGKYFCDKHHNNIIEIGPDNRAIAVCDECNQEYEKCL